MATDNTKKGDDITSVFQSKYDEFAQELLETFPEKERAIYSALALSDEEKYNGFRGIGGAVGNVTDNGKNPGTVLPGVDIEDGLWNSLSDNNKKTIWEYVRMLSVCCFLDSMFGTKDESGDGKNTKPEWVNDAMKEWSKRIEKIDFGTIFSKISNMFSSSSSPDSTSSAGDSAASGGGTGSAFPSSLPAGFPKLPEKLMKGQLAKFAAEIIALIKPEDLGLTPEVVKECEANPSRAFDILIQTISQKPEIIQNTVQRIGRGLQKKVQTGQIRPQEIAREAEELMKEFANMPEFVEVMSSFKTAFGFEDMDMARQVGREGAARLSVVKQRLRDKLDKKKQNKGR